MSSAVYVLSAFDAVLAHDCAVPLYLRDVPANADELRTRALVASGDYFETLAVCLEQVAAVMPIHSAEQLQLQEVVGQLLYLQRNYCIIKK